MSLDTWKDEFYPQEAFSVPEVHAVRHSLQKWYGLRPDALLRHRVELDSCGDVSDLITDRHLSIRGDSCALCHHYNIRYGSCKACPLALVREGVPCDEAWGDENEDSPEPGDKLSPWFEWRRRGNPEPMILWLERALEENP
jgi:hypothetical protein